MTGSLLFSSSRMAHMRLMIARVMAICFFAGIVSMEVLGQAELISDVDQREEVLNNEYSQLSAGSTNVYFVSWSSLWKTNGTAETSTKLKTFKFISGIEMVGNNA